MNLPRADLDELIRKVEVDNKARHQLTDVDGREGVELEEARQAPRVKQDGRR
jgi:hypothetical protein